MDWSKVLAVFIAPENRDQSAPAPDGGGEVATASGPPSSPPAEAFERTKNNIYRQKGISSAFSAEEALDLLSSLPKGLRGETRRQALIDLLEEKNPTFPAVVAEDARRKVDALTTAADGFSGEFAEFIKTKEDEIVKLEEEIRERKEAIEQARLQGQHIPQQCLDEAERLKALLPLLG